MKIILLLANTFFFIATANAQLQYGKRTDVRNANDRYTDSISEIPKGTALKNGKITLLSGYRIMYLDSNRVMVLKNSKGETTGAFKCSCNSNAGESRITLTGNEIHCVSGCNMDVALGNNRNIAFNQSGNYWRKIILPSGTVKRQNK